MWYPSCLGESVHSLYYPCIFVPIVFFFCDIIFLYKFLWYYWKLDHDGFVPVHLVVQVEILYVHAHVSWFDVWYGTVYMEFYGGQLWCWCADLSWIIYHIPSSSESCYMGLCFFGSDISYSSQICCPYILWFVFMVDKFDCISPIICFSTLG